MNIPIQIDTTSIARAANAPHYEYMTTFGKRTFGGYSLMLQYGLSF